MKVHALPGFLGLKTDWDVVDLSVQPHVIQPFVEDSFWTWAERFNAQVKESGILMGYSLGGRLAMHALIKNPSIWRGAVLVSVHPGLTSEDAKKQRYISDLKWAERFKQDPWELLMRDWEGQEVFKNGGFSFRRQERDYNRQRLAHILQVFSLGKQEDLRPAIHKLQVPILWVTGELDPCYSALAKSCADEHPLSQVWVASEAGHRVPWQQSFSFKERVSQFIKQLEVS